MAGSEFTIEDVRRIRLAPGEKLLVTLPARTDPDTFHRFSEELTGRFPPDTVLVVTAEVDVAVVSPP